jgi:hypothetical protein
MSLLSAMLLEAYRDPREVWIALRADGQRGSGTVDDPYNGGLSQGPPVEIDTIEQTQTDPEDDPWEVEITTVGDHGFLEGDRVTVNGVKRVYESGPSQLNHL